MSAAGLAPVTAVPGWRPALEEALPPMSEIDERSAAQRQADQINTLWRARGYEACAYVVYLPAKAGGQPTWEIRTPGLVNGLPVGRLARDRYG